MEIGISSEQLIDIGLNMAGFLAAGLLVFVINSLFTKSNRTSVATSAGMIMVEKREPVTKPVEVSPVPKAKMQEESRIEFINLNGVNWNAPDERPGRPEHVRSVGGRRGEIINLANEIIKNRGADSHNDRTTQIKDNKLPSFLNNNKIRMAGRSK